LHDLIPYESGKRDKLIFWGLPFKLCSCRNLYPTSYRTQTVCIIKIRSVNIVYVLYAVFIVRIVRSKCTVWQNALHLIDAIRSFHWIINVKIVVDILLHFGLACDSFVTKFGSGNHVLLTGSQRFLHMRNVGSVRTSAIERV